MFQFEHHFVSNLLLFFQILYQAKVFLIVLAELKIGIFQHVDCPLQIIIALTLALQPINKVLYLISHIQVSSKASVMSSTSLRS